MELKNLGATLRPSTRNRKENQNMSTNTSPVLRIELESMRHTLKLAISEHLSSMDEIIQKEIDRVCTSENVASIVAQAADQEIKDTISDAVHYFYRYGPGREAIFAVIRETLSERKS